MTPAAITHLGVARSNLRTEWVECRDNPMQRLFQRASNTVNRIIERAVVRGAVKASESGDAASLATYLARGRNMYMRYNAPNSMQMASALSGMHIRTDAHTRTALLHNDEFKADATLVYVHGGSFIADRSPRLTALIARIAKAAQLNAVMVDYRLAPEHPCPAAIDDVVLAVRNLINRGQPASRIGLVAESAGAAIALSAAMKLRDTGLRLGALCFLSPWTDLALTGRSAAARSLTGDSPISMESMAICAHLYLQGMSALDPIASPVFGDLGRLPPMLVHTSKTDALHDDARLLSQRAHAAGTDVTLRIWSHGSHVFERLFDRQANRAISEAGAFLRTHLGSADRARDTA